MAKNTTPYEIAQPMYNVETVNNMLNDMKENFEIHIVTWLSKKIHNHIWNCYNERKKDLA